MTAREREAKSCKEDRREAKDEGKESKELNKGKRDQSTSTNISYRYKGVRNKYTNMACISILILQHGIIIICPHSLLLCDLEVIRHFAAWNGDG